MNFKYYITYDTLKKHVSDGDVFLYEKNVEYFLISNYPKLRYYHIWKWCFFRGILPNKIFFGKKLFRKNTYAIRDVLEKVENINEIILVTDYDIDRDSVRDIKHLKICDFQTFKKMYVAELKNKLQPFS